MCLPRDYFCSANLFKRKDQYINLYRCDQQVLAQACCSYTGRGGSSGAAVADYLKAWHRAVPSCIALRMLSSHSCSCSIGTPEDYWYRNSARWHVQCFCSWIYDLVDGLHGKIEGHELAHRSESCHSSSSSYAREACLWNFTPFVSF